MNGHKETSSNEDSLSGMCSHGNFPSDCIDCKKSSEQSGFLTETDRKYLLESATTVANTIALGDSPDIVIFPDTSARPLYYLFNPLFNYLAERDGNYPQYFFISPNKDVGKVYSETVQILEKRLENDKLDKKTQDMLKRILHFVRPLVRDQYQYKSAIDNRAKSILKNTINKENPRIIAIDDYFYDGETAKELFSVFGQNLEFYALLCGLTDEADKLGVIYGMADPFVPEQMRGKTGSLGFNFRQGKNRLALGVEKMSDRAVASALPPAKRKAHSLEIAELRGEMRKIGEEVLTKIAPKSE